MRPFHSLLVCLDLTEIDDLLLRYASYIVDCFGDISKVVLLHNIRFDYPEDAEEVVQSLERPLADMLHDIIREKADQIFGGRIQDCDTEIQITEQKSTPNALAAVVKEKNINLVIAGKKINYEGSGITVEMLLRVGGFNASILWVPETAYHRIQKVLLPIDFSRASLEVIKSGKYIKEHTDSKLEYMHVFNIPVHYFPFIAVDNLQKKMRKDAENQWQDFKKKHHTVGLEEASCALVFSRGNNVSQSIYNYALKQQTDLIVIHTKGKGALTSMMIGSVANRLIQLDTHIPILILKNSPID